MSAHRSSRRAVTPKTKEKGHKVQTEPQQPIETILLSSSSLLFYYYYYDN